MMSALLYERVRANCSQFHTTDIDCLEPMFVSHERAKSIERNVTG